MKLLLDENLSPRLVPRLAGLGIHAMHVAHAGRAGLSDVALFRYALEQDMAVVTINAADFLTLAADCELHPGLIVLRVGGLTADEQWQHLESIIQLIAVDPATNAGLVNEVIEILGLANSGGIDFREKTTRARVRSALSTRPFST